jgi:hypothetical protein
VDTGDGGGGRAEAGAGGAHRSRFGFRGGQFSSAAVEELEVVGRPTSRGGVVGRGRSHGWSAGGGWGRTCRRGGGAERAVLEKRRRDSKELSRLGRWCEVDEAGVTLSPLSRDHPHRSYTGGGAHRVVPEEVATVDSARDGVGSQIGNLGERVEENDQMGDWRRRRGGGRKVYL